MVMTATRMNMAKNLDELYREHGPAVAKLAYLVTGDQQLAEDLTQDAFLRVWDKLDDIDDPAAVGAYIKKTVVNLARNQFRHNAVARKHAEKLKPELKQSITDTAKIQMRDAVFNAMQQLPERQREILVCKYYLQLSEAETAELLDIPAGTVKSNTSRAMESLRELLAGI